MIQIIVGVIIFVVMALACYFVNDTKKKHGTCCGKGCNGCPIIEEEYHERKKRLETKKSQEKKG